MNANKKVMARNITNQLIKHNMKATDLCKALGFKHNTVSDWVNAKAYPRIDAIEKMANYFGISKAFLVEDMADIEVFTEDERRFIIEYRRADQVTRDAIRRLLAYEDKVRDAQ